uniref:Death domain-containing protein n=1 Tax=Amphimedon queenslandica TaxID=400682 RepID=A0A1X7TS79_AMPQE
KVLDMAAVMKIFRSSARLHITIGVVLGVNVSDLMSIPGTASTRLQLVFQRWFDADRDVNWDTLIKLCDSFSGYGHLGRAKSNLLEYIGLIQNASQGISVSDDLSKSSLPAPQSSSTSA